LDFDISEHRDHHLKTELHKISFKNFPTDCASVAAPKFRIRFYENFQFFVEASVAIASAATVQLGFWFWHDLEIKAELRAWYYHKRSRHFSSSFLDIFPGRLKPGIRNHGECSPIARSKPEHAWLSTEPT
jgi:hypothetical protein